MVGSQPPSSADAGQINFDAIRKQNRLPPNRAGAPSRQFWSEADTHRLIKLIDLHKCKWAIIAKRQDARGRKADRPNLEPDEDLIFDVKRDQQAIRDKARNIKVDLLK